VAAEAQVAAENSTPMRRIMVRLPQEYPKGAPEFQQQNYLSAKGNRPFGIVTALP